MWASEAPCSSISKNQMKSLKPGHHIAIILLFRTHHLWNSTTELILNLIYLLTLGYTIEHNWTRQIRWSLEGWMARGIRCCENLQFNWREILVSRSGNFPNRNVTSLKYFGVLLPMIPRIFSRFNITMYLKKFHSQKLRLLVVWNENFHRKLFALAFTFQYLPKSDQKVIKYYWL